MKGTILDFLNLASEKEALARELLELATKYDFEFTDEELSEAELDSVAGGAADEMGAEMSFNLQMAMDRRSKLVQTMSNIMKKMSSTQDSIVQNIK